MPVLVLIRHGQSLWNAQNKFTGWEDIDLSPKGKKEAQKAGQLLAQTQIEFHLTWTSILKRAQNTLNIILQELQIDTPIYQTWRLNERHYGKLQGWNKQQTILEYGEEQVFQWRRSFHIKPPLLSQKEAEEQSKRPIFQNIPKKLFPRGESLKDTLDRVLPLWQDSILPMLKKNKNILITAHGNSLRSLVKHIQKIDDDSISQFEIPTATPLKIQWDSLFIEKKPVVFEFLKKIT